MLVDKKAGSEDEFLAGRDNLFEDEPKFCKRDVMLDTEYWPTLLSEEVGELLSELCTDEV